MNISKRLKVRLNKKVFKCDGVDLYILRNQIKRAMKGVKLKLSHRIDVADSDYIYGSAAAGGTSHRSVYSMVNTFYGNS